MPRMEILSAIEREEFDAPPTFTLAQQQRYFEPSLELARLGPAGACEQKLAVCTQGIQTGLPLVDRRAGEFQFSLWQQANIHKDASC